MTTILSTVAAIVRHPYVKWSAIAIASLFALALIVIYGGSEWRLRRTYDTPQVALREIGRAPSVERGKHLSLTTGCQGCHGPAGLVFLDVPMLGRLIAPNLSRVAADYSDAELATLLRTGIKRDRTSLIIMPSEAYAWLADEDVADVIAWLRSLKPEPDAQTATTSWGPLGRAAMLTGGFPFTVDLVKPAAPPILAPREPLTVRGEYLEKVLCGACHLLHAEHEVRPGDVAPALAPVAQGYDDQQMRRLLRTGLGLGDRELGLMTEVSLGTLKHLDDEEIAAIHAYLRGVKLEEPADAK